MVGFGDGLNGTVRSILVNGNDIYVGGQFTTAGGNTAFAIARWDGSSRHPLGRGINQSLNAPALGTAYSLLASSEGLYVGGQFTHAGDKYSNMIALYTDFTTSVDEKSLYLPDQCLLDQNYPNPFNPSTTIQFSIPEQSFVKIEIFNSLGEMVSTLVSEELNTGNYKTEWTAMGLPSGVYYCTMVANGFLQTRKLVLLK